MAFTIQDTVLSSYPAEPESQEGVPAVLALKTSQPYIVMVEETMVEAFTPVKLANTTHRAFPGLIAETFSGILLSVLPLESFLSCLAQNVTIWVISCFMEEASIYCARYPSTLLKVF